MLVRFNIKYARNPKERKKMNLDQKISILVMNLLRLGIRSLSSCQGHRNHGLPYPWVDIDSCDAKKVVNLVTWYNLLVYRKETRSRVPWIILPRATFRIMPEQRELDLKVLQTSAEDFGAKIRTLKRIPDKAFF